MNTELIVSTIKKNPISIGCGALSLVLLVIAYFISDSVPNAKAQLQALQADSEKLSANIEYSAKLSEQYKTLVTANTIIDSRLVRSAQLAQNLQYFYKLESDTNSKLTNLTQVPPPVKPGTKGLFTPVGFSITVAGDYATELDVLRRLENGPHYCRILGVHLTPADRANLNMVLDVQLELEGKP